jgi:hypothetical protein
VTGSGTHYAVAYTAAEAALVRAAYPDLTAQQVTHRIKVTADRMGDGEPPHSQYGWGFLNPGEAVTKVLAEEAAPVPSAPAASVAPTEAAAGPDRGDSGGGGKSTVLIATALIMIAAALLLGHRIWRLLRKDDDEDDAGPAPEPEIDLYDTRFRAPMPELVTSGGGPAPPPPPAGGPMPGARKPVDDGGEAHWNEVGGHWSDESPPR